MCTSGFVDDVIFSRNGPRCPGTVAQTTQNSVSLRLSTRAQQRIGAKRDVYIQFDWLVCELWECQRLDCGNDDDDDDDYYYY